MVLRHDDAGVLAVGQASHAWLCGQFARAWGNERFGAVEPLDEVALGAEQHDVGMAAWDLEPVRNPETGLPQSFMEMGPEVNAGLWSAGPQRLVTQSRYGALLAILHGRRLYERFDLAGAPPAQAQAVSAFLRHADALQRSLREALSADPFIAPHATPERIEHNSRLVWTWDLISLALLLRLGADDARGGPDRRRRRRRHRARGGAALPAPARPGRLWFIRWIPGRSRRRRCACIATDGVWLTASPTTRPWQRAWHARPGRPWSSR